VNSLLRRDVGAIEVENGRSSNTVAIAWRDREQSRGRSAFGASVTIMGAGLADSKSAAVVAPGALSGDAVAVMKR
jgi:hypothetical protein